jgi:hypothetical protein
MPETIEDIKEAILDGFRRDRWLAHQKLFPHRHPDRSPPAHKALVAAINAPRPRVSIEGFRGFAKSTYLEETAVLKAVFLEYRNLVIVGASYARACERLAPIKREFEMNEEMLSLTGDLKGATWQEGKVTLTIPQGIAKPPAEVCIQALGRDQSMTGMKHLDWRPDAALIDDVEDPEEVRTDAQREGTWNWFLKTFLPSLDHPLYSWVRVLGTRRGVGSLPERLESDGWQSAKFPVETVDGEGNRRATWPSKFPLDAIDKMKATYRGDMHTYMQEYMCVATSEADRVFTREMFRVEPRVRTWQAVYAMIDPARTTNRTSATTGWAVWSWLSNRLIVWAAGAAMLKPDEIIDLTFTIAEEFNPVWIGVEEDGLNEFILQPLRHEQLRRSHTIPVKAIRAPRSKMDFIRGLQPFFAAGEVLFNAALPELEAQLLSFPTGRIDAPNALAYALPMRPVAPVYESVAVESLVDEHDPDPSRPLYLAANATGSLTTAVLCQNLSGEIRVYADWVEEGAPAETVARIYAEASLIGDAALSARPRVSRWQDALKLPDISPILRRDKPKWIVPPHHGNEWNNVGLEQGIRRLPSHVAHGGDYLGGRHSLSQALRQARPALAVSERAGWVLRALAGGYSRALRRGGQLGEEAEPGVYRVLMEGLESFAAMSAFTNRDDDDNTGQPWAYDKRGVAYRSILPQRN